MPTQQTPLNPHFNPQQQSQPNTAPYTTQQPPPNQSYHPQQPQVILLIFLSFLEKIIFL